MANSKGEIEESLMKAFLKGFGGFKRSQQGW